MAYDYDHQALSIKTIEHMFQNGVEKRFQEYAPNYMKGGAENRVTKDVPLGAIREVPIYMFVAEEDNVCPKEQALWTAEQIGKAVQEVRIFDKQDHAFFTYSLDLVLMESLLYVLEKDERPYIHGV